MKSHEQKRTEGEERNAEWRAKTAKEQLDSLKMRRGESKSQIKRIKVQAKIAE